MTQAVLIRVHADRWGLHLASMNFFLPLVLQSSSGVHVNEFLVVCH